MNRLIPICLILFCLIALFLAAAGRCAAQEREAAAPADEVLTGIDVLEREQFARLRGRRLGLITNHTGINRRGEPTALVLKNAPGVTLAALFSPEHGYEGRLDRDKIADGRDPLTGVPIYSLYGETRKPTAASLQEIDTLVFDIQDIGARFYTYISTMGAAMQAAAEHQKRFLVLDRPNPIGGTTVSGPLLDAGRESFTAFHSLPVRHGMTVGELARMFQKELNLPLDLEVVAMEGWRREQLFEDTGLAWINPSPNMRNMNAALLYPGIGLLETTNLSVGRGTDTPFERLGAPWLDGRRLAAELRRAGIEGVAFLPIAFTPSASVFQGEACQGVQFAITDRASFDPLRLGLEIAVALRRLYPDQWQVDKIDRLLASRQTLAAIESATPAAEIQASLAPAVEEFLSRRKQFLIYPQAR